MTTCLSPQHLVGQTGDGPCNTHWNWKKSRRLCSEKQNGEQSKKASDVIFWPPHSHASHMHSHICGGGEDETRGKTNNRRKLMQTVIPLFTTSSGSILKLVAKAEEDAYSYSPALRSSGLCLTWLPGIQLIMPSLLTSTPRSIDKVTVV